MHPTYFPRAGPAPGPFPGSPNVSRPAAAPHTVGEKPANIKENIADGEAHSTRSGPEPVARGRAAGAENPDQE